MITVIVVMVMVMTYNDLLNSLEFGAHQVFSEIQLAKKSFERFLQLFV